MTLPTGPAAGVHLPWANVPAAVKGWAAAIGGGEPTEVRDVHGGFSPGATAWLECPCGAVFVKAVGEELNPESPALHRREAVVSAALPAWPTFPVLLDFYDQGGWVALAFEAIEGRVPRHPWDRSELDTVVNALQAVHETLTPSPAAHIDTAPRYFRHLFGGWAELAAARDTPGLDPWCRKNLFRLVELETHWPEAISGETLVHGDIRSDNILLGPSGPVFVDWPTPPSGTRCSTSSRGRLRSCWRAGPNPKSSWPAMDFHDQPTPTSCRCWSQRSAASSCRTRIGHPHPACPPCAPSRWRKVRSHWTGCVVAPDGDGGTSPRACR